MPGQRQITDDELLTVSTIVQKQVHYTNLVERQGAALQKMWPDPLDAYRNLTMNLEPLPVDPVQRAERLAKAEAICRLNPETVEDRLAILSASISIVNAIIADELCQLPQHLSLVAARLYSKSEFWRDPDELAKEKERGQIKSGQPQVPKTMAGFELEPLLRPVNFKSKAMTSLQVQSLLKDGQEWLGHCFILPDHLPLDSGGGVLMRLVEVGTSLQGKWFEVHYEGATFGERVDAEELSEMLHGALMIID